MSASSGTTPAAGAALQNSGYGISRTGFEVLCSECESAEGGHHLRLGLEHSSVTVSAVEDWVFSFYYSVLRVQEVRASASAASTTP